MKCKNCDVEMKKNQKFCIECGIPNIDILLCPTCKTTVVKKQRFCSSCGTYLVIKTPVTNNIKEG